LATTWQHLQHRGQRLLPFSIGSRIAFEDTPDIANGSIARFRTIAPCIFLPPITS
jgi:hypothetical protein